jgi:outer membrane protein assembly factor BamE
MRFKLFSVAVLSLAILATGCSTVKKIVYRPDINQGNYLAPTDVAKVQKGMTKEQVVYLLGSPMLQDPFGSNTWFYVFRQQPGHEDVTQQTLTLTFDDSGTLTNIKNEEPYPPQ